MGTAPVAGHTSAAELTFSQRAAKAADGILRIRTGNSRLCNSRVSSSSDFRARTERIPLPTALPYADTCSHLSSAGSSAVEQQYHGSRVPRRGARCISWPVFPPQHAPAFQICPRFHYSRSVAPGRGDRAAFLSRVTERPSDGCACAFPARWANCCGKGRLQATSSKLRTARIQTAQITSV